jgi:uncharacterized alpha-E superfamily protein
MLSRIAESLFWIGRYLERADGTARLLDVHLQLLLEDPWVEEDIACRALLSVMGSSAPDDRELSRVDLLEILGVERDNTTSIAFSLDQARENARRAREVISSEMWEVLNTNRAKMPRRVSADKVHGFFSWVRDRTALAVGTMESSAIRDETWSFFTVGRSIERADMTARLLSTRALIEEGGPSWTTILRSCGAYEAYLRRYRGMPSAENAAEFLVLDRLFPRSILFQVIRAETCVQEIEPQLDRSVITNTVLRELGQIRGELEFQPVEQILHDLPAYMERIQLRMSEISEALRQRYFPVLSAPTWIREDA